MSIQTLKVVDGRLMASNEPYDATLIEVSKQTGNAIQIKEDGLYVQVVNTDAETIIDPELDSRLIGLENTDIVHNQKIAALEASESTQDNKIANLESASGTQATKISNLETESTTQGERLGVLEPTVNTHTQQITDLQTSQTTQDTKISDIESELEKNKTIASATTGNISTVTKTENGFEVYTPSIVEEVSSAVELPPNLENSLPIYTLGNNGEYVLCQPDNWIKIGDNYIPSYNGTTIGKVVE